jgi:uncharacterized NAD(P)/FAD-binding protein YdhS
MHSPPRILIVGAGFAGSLLAVQLAAKAQTPLHITLCDAAGAFARGVAYSTREPVHLLNVRADRMGAFEDRQDDFYRWLLANEAEWRALDPTLAALPVTPQSFMPRMVYGAYVSALFARAQNSRTAAIEKIPLEVTDAQFSPDGITLTLANGSRHTADRMVLATGNLPGCQSAFEKKLGPTSRYTHSIWSPPEGSILTRRHFDSTDEPVLIIGTGLTMVDAFLSLRPSYPHFLLPESAPRKALGLFTAIRHEVKRAYANGIGWHGVIDALRARTPALWGNLPERERAKLLRVIATWGTHRHRMPESSANALESEIACGKLSIHTGSVVSITQARDEFQIHLRGQIHTIKAAHVINCTGPVMNIEASGSPLLLSLLKDGLIRKGPLGMGIAADADGKAAGNGMGKIFALGPLLIGERLESIAVPELRKQAEALATALIASL